MSKHSNIDRQYGLSGLMEKIETGLELTGKETGSLAVKDLAPVDGFHTRGREATLELAGQTTIKPSDQILDVGCGLGGTVRYLAEQYKCNVSGIDITGEYISVGKKLTDLVGLENRIDLRQGSATDIPYENSSFDIVWTEHVQMNIADKNLFYSEIARVLKPGGRLLFHDVFRGAGEDPVYPVPWADDESLSFLVTGTDARQTMEQAGLQLDHWAEKRQESIDFFERVVKRIQADGLPPLGIHLLMGITAKDKILNYLRNIVENRVTVAMGLAVKS